MAFLLTVLCLGTVKAQTLTSGTLYTNTIAANGTNSFTFTANAGDTVVLRIGQVTGGSYFVPWLRVYGPGEVLIGLPDPAHAYASELVITATNGGTYRVEVSDGAYGGTANSGTYELNFFDIQTGVAVSAGDEGGPLTNGTLNAGTISSGDIDAWTFTASSGDSVVLRVGELTYGDYHFGLWLRVYGPDGALVGEGNGGELRLCE